MLTIILFPPFISNKLFPKTLFYREQTLHQKSSFKHVLISFYCSLLDTIGMRHVREAQSIATRAYAQSGQYHTIVESHVHLTWYQSHVPKLSHANKLVNHQMSNKGLQKKRSGAFSKAQ